MNTPENIQSCIICGDEASLPMHETSAICDFCGETKSIALICNSHHHICSKCMELTPTEFVRKKCLSYKGYNPIELAVEIMNSPLIGLSGVEHHYITPAVLLTCTHNRFNKPEELAATLENTMNRAICETPAQCTYIASYCGAAIGTGVFLNIFMGRDSSNTDEWMEENTLIAACIAKIADFNGPRCCKRDTYLSIIATIEYLKEKFNIELPVSDAKCTFSLRNKSCGREECNFYNLGFSIV